LKPSKIIIHIDTCNGSRLTFTNMLWRYRHCYTSYAVRAFSAHARQREHAPAGASTCRSERATRMNFYSHARCNRQHKDLQTARSIIALTERETSFRSHLPITFSDLFPIALTHYVRKQSDLSQVSACLNTFFLEIYRAICLGNTVYL